MQNAFHILLIAWLFRGICQLVCVFQKAFWSSFHAPTDLWNSVLKTKPIFKAVTVFSFTSLHFSWGREALAKSRISSVKIIILAYSLLFFFSWGFNSGRLMQSKWMFFQSSPRQLSLGVHPFFNHQIEYTAVTQRKCSYFQLCGYIWVHYIQ